jgi:hypothetical protein
LANSMFCMCRRRIDGTARSCIVFYLCTIFHLRIWDPSDFLEQKVIRQKRAHVGNRTHVGIYTRDWTQSYCMRGKARAIKRLINGIHAYLYRCTSHLRVDGNEASAKPQRLGATMVEDQSEGGSGIVHRAGGPAYDNKCRGYPPPTPTQAYATAPGWHGIGHTRPHAHPAWKTGAVVDKRAVFGPLLGMAALTEPCDVSH